MDFLVEHSDDPIPDASNPIATSTGNAAVRGGGKPMDEDEDHLEAVEAAYGKAKIAPAANTSAAEDGSQEAAEAKVRFLLQRHSWLGLSNYCTRS